MCCPTVFKLLVQIYIRPPVDVIVNSLLVRAITPAAGVLEMVNSMVPQQLFIPLVRQSTAETTGACYEDDK